MHNLFDPETEISGSLMQSILSDPIDTAAWYPLRDMLHAMRTANVVAAGLVSAAHLTQQGDASLDAALQRLGERYAASHRGANPGHVLTQRVSAGHWRITTWVPYPHDFFYGLLHGLANGFQVQQVLITRQVLSANTVIFDMRWASGARMLHS